MEIKERIGTIQKVAGPLVVASGMENVQVYDVVRVSNKKLIGEVIELRGGLASIQVYEETAGIGPGEPVYYTNEPLSAELGPGLIGSIFDGIQRPLNIIYEAHGEHIPLGIDLPRLNREKQWDFVPVAKLETNVSGGMILGTVRETAIITHKIMVPPDVAGRLVWLHTGLAKVKDVIAKIVSKEGKTIELTMLQYWPVRKKRPYINKLAPRKIMVTGQRVIDSLFPISIGGIAAIPGPFGSGKTVVQQQLAKWADADIIIYVGCGERGNEMTDVLMEFPLLKDPLTGESLMQRTVLIANTSNMPVAAREASIYTGITIAEYYRDMGYKVAIMADSTSRWAEALREMSSRLEEMPGEEGYPAYLSSRLAEFYERAGYVACLGDKHREGAITAIGAVSPPGGDTSEPVSQATLRIVKVFWGLSDKLAYRRHFPAIDWLKSYSLYEDVIHQDIDEHLHKDWSHIIRRVQILLQEEASLQEIVRLVGLDSLSKNDRVKLLTAQMIREDYLHQNAYHEIDTYTSIDKQRLMLNLILSWYDLAHEAMESKKSFLALERMIITERIGRVKYVPENEVAAECLSIQQAMEKEFSTLAEE
ncbi:MAG: V-type ATP synthase subunit A [Bacilli bacterium]|jgi:V/A-type H+-transporting ATPase subunit A